MNGVSVKSTHARFIFLYKKPNTTIMTVTLDDSTIDSALLKGVDTRDLNQWLTASIKDQGYILHDIAIQLVGDEQLLKANQAFLSHDTYTDVITFDRSREHRILGDIMISIDRVVANANELKISVDKELHRMVIHGALHLCGYVDTTQAERSHMHDLENNYLSQHPNCSTWNDDSEKYE